jgi:hypothetical protein
MLCFEREDRFLGILNGSYLVFLGLSFRAVSLALRVSTSFPLLSPHAAT